MDDLMWKGKLVHVEIVEATLWSLTREQEEQFGTRKSDCVFVAFQYNKINA